MVAVGVWVGAQVLRTEIQQHKHAMAECLVIIGDRIAEANLAAQRQEELMTQRRVKTMAWRNRRLHVMELQESQANRARLQAEAEARRVQRLQQRQRLAEEETKAQVLVEKARSALLKVLQDLDQGLDKCITQVRSRSAGNGSG